MAYRYQYQSSPRTPAQKTGYLPWIVVGMACAVGLAVVLVVLLRTRSLMVVQNEADQQIASRDSTMMAIQDASDKILESPRAGAIDVPIDPPVKTSDKKPTAVTSDKSLDDLDAELDGSGASLLLELIGRAAMTSFQSEVPKAGEADPKADPNEPASEDLKTEKPVSAVRSLTKALVMELPEGIDETTALKSLGRFLGRAIAAESVMQPELRPEWVDRSSGVDSSTGQYRTVITLGPDRTRPECDSRLDTELHKVVADYAERYLGPTARGRVVLSKGQLNRLITNTYQESINTSVGPMVNVHVELAFSSETRDLIQERFRESLVQDRIVWSSFALGSVALFLLGAFGVLKLDPLYRRRLLIAVGTGVALLLGLGILFIV